MYLTSHAQSDLDQDLWFTGITIGVDLGLGDPRLAFRGTPSRVPGFVGKRRVEPRDHDAICIKVERISLGDEKVKALPFRKGELMPQEMKPKTPR